MQLTVNGKKMDVDDGIILFRLLQSLNISPDTVVAERNGKIVDRAEFETCTLTPDDRIELVRFVGGG